jgi:Protein of unknown function (DUF3363)
VGEDRLVERDQIPLAMDGFGQEVRDAMSARAEHLVSEGLARREGPRIVPQHGLLATLQGRELDATGARLSAETGCPAHRRPVVRRSPAPIVGALR